MACAVVRLDQDTVELIWGSWFAGMGTHANTVCGYSRSRQRGNVAKNLDYVQRATGLSQW